MKRRDFIKITSLSAGGIIIGGSMLKWAYGETTQNSKPNSFKGERFPTICEVCFWKCAGWVYKDENGNIQKIIGNNDDPHSNGRLCPRGTGGVGMYNDTDRLKRPMIRVGEAGSQQFKEVSWEEALDFVAQKMKTIGEKHGYESIALLDHGTTANHFEHLFSSFGSETSGEPAIAQCLGAREAAFIATYGSGIGSPEPVDIRNAKCVVFLGSHIGENMHNGVVQDVSYGIDHDLSIITVDPRFSTVASKSKFWLPIKPSTDMALLLAWMNVLITEELYDKDYVEQYTFGFEQLKAHVANYTPEWAATKTDLSSDLIRKTAYEMAEASPAVAIHPGRHVAWYGDDTQRVRAIAIINALLGSWGRKGGFYFAEKKSLPKFPMPHYPEPKWTWKDITLEKYKGAFTGVTNIIVDASLPDATTKHKVKAWFVVATNIIQSIPDLKKTEKAIQNLDLLVVVDTMPMEITGYADVILPECTYLERYDYLRASRHKIPTIALRMPAVEPKYDTKPGWWIAREIGLRLGLEKYFPWENLEEVLDWQLKQIGSSLDEMKKIGVKSFEKEEPLYLAKGEDYEFGTSSGKIELYSTDLEAMGYDPMPKYKDHPQPPAGYLRLIYGRVPMHTFGRTTNNPNLNDLMSENHLWVSPKIAKINGLKNNQEVWLKNQDEITTTNSVKVRITERIRHDSVYLPHGFGHTIDKLSTTFGKGAADSQLTTSVVLDEVTGGTGMRGNFVTILVDNPNKEEVVS